MCLVSVTDALQFQRKSSNIYEEFVLNLKSDNCQWGKG